MSKTSAKKGVQQLVEVFYQRGIRHIVFSPGSRNAPLVIAFANDERFQTFVIPDERSAAFYALGIAEQSQNPVAVMCTSGSAVLNYGPAVSEAFYRNIPLIVVSADRPKEWIDQGDGQTIRQENVLQNHCKAFIELLEHPITSSEESTNIQHINAIINAATHGEKGPVHINFPFNEPLYEQVEKTESNSEEYTAVEEENELAKEQLEEIKRIWNSTSKVLILCGQMPKNPRLNEQLRELSTQGKVTVLVENTSNLQDRNFIHCIDRTIESFLEGNSEVYHPELLISIGGSIISKKIKKYFRTHPPKYHWKVGINFPEMNTYQKLDASFAVKETVFFNHLLKEDKGEQSRYGEQWRQLNLLVKGQHEDYLASIPYSDLKVYELLLDAVPESANLHISNSSTIRYTQLFDPIKSISYFCNRGTSGIDGSMSTALGNTLASPDKLNVLIIGDMSFFYDSNALWNQHLPSNFRVFLINNSGGSIFDIIPGPASTPNLDQYFVAAHQHSAEYLCKAFDVNYFKATSLEEIDRQLNEFLEIYDNDRPGLMEIFTPRATNTKVLAAYFKKIVVKNTPIL